MTAARRDVEEKRVVVGDREKLIRSLSWQKLSQVSNILTSLCLNKWKHGKHIFLFFTVTFSSTFSCLVIVERFFPFFVFFFFLHADANKNIDATWGYLSGRWIDWERGSAVGLTITIDRDRHSIFDFFDKWRNLFGVGATGFGDRF